LIKSSAGLLNFSVEPFSIINIFFNSPPTPSVKIPAPSLSAASLSENPAFL